MDKAFDGLLAPGRQHALAEAAREALHAGEAETVHLAGVAVEDVNAGVRQDLVHFLLLPGFVIMVAQHGNDGDPQDT